MRKLATVLTVLGALSFLGGMWRVLFGRMLVGAGILAVSPETYWRAATGFLLLAITLVLLERSATK